MNQENQILSPELEARVHQAVENFMQGYGCCQSVVAAFADLYGLDETMAKSKQQNGSIICAEILGLKGYEKAQSSYVASARTAEYYKSRPCAAKVESAARIFAEYLMEK